MVSSIAGLKASDEITQFNLTRVLGSLTVTCASDTKRSFIRLFLKIDALQFLIWNSQPHECRLHIVHTCINLRKP